eukprot:CAMPEP_0176358634 /NCGR_PEP_ID=MMETSP0126-20121128/15719_1 /TAXON_ID=141414 ORGANISM="Strombidinopsis acuminatum, Strain SPMC142" /NCGR_SAMPLE_ID=MMETSP0126 /ASSEMBLY_ACC=CAM_ASM_000229 /LENGTH=49 /DNA_ID=CAMNT_0017712937 /DNA_START=1393 /DNA_END=1542 /DNA_ORIENTATION=+
MWVKKLDEEIEKNATGMNKLTDKIKELQDQNYKLEYDHRINKSEKEKLI